MLCEVIRDADGRFDGLLSEGATGCIHRITLAEYTGLYLENIKWWTRSCMVRSQFSSSRASPVGIGRNLYELWEPFKLEHWSKPTGWRLSIPSIIFNSDQPMSIMQCVHQLDDWLENHRGLIANFSDASTIESNENGSHNKFRMKSCPHGFCFVNYIPSRNFHALGKRFLIIARMCRRKFQLPEKLFISYHYSRIPAKSHQTNTKCRYE